MRKRPSLLLMAAAVILASTTGSARAASSAQTAPPTTGQQVPRKRPPLPKIVNLQILPKDTPPEEVIRIMRGFQGQLGVECNFCHVSDPKTHHLNFASDAKSEKAAGRLMMSMTHEINSKYLKQLPPMDHHHEDGEEGEHDAEGADHAAEPRGPRRTCRACGSRRTRGARDLRYLPSRPRPSGGLRPASGGRARRRTPPAPNGARPSEVAEGRHEDVLVSVEASTTLSIRRVVPTTAAMATSASPLISPIGSSVSGSTICR